MKVEYLFSRNKKIGSRLIAWAARFEKLGLDKNPSHIAVLINEELVIESTLGTGVRIIPYSHWKTINEQLHRIPCTEEYRSSKRTLSSAFRLWGKKYDWSGIAYFGYCFLRLIISKIPLPKENKWQKSNKYFCTEYAGSLTGQDFSMHSPARICAEWLEDTK